MCCGLGGNPAGRDLIGVSEAPVETGGGPVTGCRSVGFTSSTPSETVFPCVDLPTSVAVVDTVELAAAPLTWSIPGVSRLDCPWSIGDTRLAERLRITVGSAATPGWFSACSCLDTSSVGEPLSGSCPEGEALRSGWSSSPFGDSRSLPGPFLASLPSGSGRRKTLSPFLTGPETPGSTLFSPPETVSTPWAALNSSKQEYPFTRANASRAMSTNSGSSSYPGTLKLGRRQSKGLRWPASVHAAKFLLFRTVSENERGYMCLQHMIRRVW